MSIDADRWSRLEEVFAAAAPLTGRRQARFLAHSCGGDGELRRRVEELLHADRSAEGFVEAALCAGASAVLSDDGGVPAGHRIGAYRVIRELGRGGMSSVYLAHRADHELRYQVAIKIVRRGMDTEDILRRFHSERQILASLDHPNIARFLGGGSTDDGRPYFVMEHIEASSILDYCDAARLATRQRVELFRQVCSAVHHAHRNLVVHRDLKPSNVLVTAEGMPKLLDFGIAKLLTPDLAAGAGDPTSTGLRLMTPGYASPEQIRGGPITTATDVYSLGVLLYELLTGHRPYRLGSREPAEKPSLAISRRGANVSGEASFRDRPTPEGLSRVRAASPEQLRRRLRGDLDNIVLMALRKEPERRYHSAWQLAEDLERHLSGHPVVARHDTLAYRLSKFVRRHRLGTVVGSAVATLAVAFTLALSIQSSRISSERDRATQVSAMLVDLFELVGPGEARGATITARELLDRGARKVMELDARAETAVLVETLARLYEELSLFSSAVPLYRRALDIQRQVAGEGAPEVATSLNDLGRALAQQGEYAEAEPLFRQALELRRGLYGEAHPSVGSSLNNLALVIHDLGDYRRAEPLYRQALALDRKLLGAEHPGTAVTLSNLALLLHDEGNYGEAEKLYREVLQIRRRRLAADDPRIALSLDTLGRTVHARGAHQEAEPLLRRALALRQEVLGEHSATAYSLESLGNLLRDRGRLGEAAPLLHRALQLRRSLLGEPHPDIAANLESLARLAAAQGDKAKAEELFRRAEQMYGEVLPDGHPLLARSILGLAELLAEHAECQRAEPLLRRALELRRRVLPPQNWQIAEVQSALAGCLVARGNGGEAASMVEASYQVLRADLGADHPRTRRASARREALLPTPR